MAAHAFDVIVVGAGNAGLTAALAAREAGARVLVLEAANRAERGGNSRFTGGIFRAAHDGLDAIKPILHPDNAKWYDRVETGPYTPEAYAADWSATSEGRQDPELMRITIERSFETLRWMHGKGVAWELTADKQVDPAKQAEGTRITVPPGGAIRAYHEGIGLMDSLFRAVEATDIEVWYDAPAADLLTRGSTVVGVRVRRADEFVDVHGNVVLAAGGFEANPEMRLRYLGPGWDLVRVRGSRFNMGAMLTKATLAGAQAVGHWGGAHAVPVDFAAPPVGDLRITDKMSRYSYPYALLVNRNGERFIDEGEAQVWLTYAKTGWAVRAQPGAVAYQIFDQKTLHLLEPRYATGTPVVADTLGGLARELGIPEKALLRTVDDFNAAVADDAEERFVPLKTDGVAAEPAGQPPKSHWALRIDRGPFVCYPVTCGITFTYGGIRIDGDARVVSTEGTPMPGLYATGEISGGFFYHNYGAGTGLMRGAVFGRIAGTNAAARAASVSEPAAVGA
ncbi:FAD-dependent tricarballylate dehydrogenase TcuA [Yinghuangia sp. ASG 101]|uniref:FAD-dependent tricarballylate dehydrogenase TcuA n=1 Tax=Yinghuangia sp. ASG 101 TaxID=2896848 RepID=UPI001E2A51DD|nr:FAD-dependent tricarballylate dehydrogenase TcuA [Yinghuangia sp. ASG 101]UGQ13373.1 FAD-dependent tricarballylate dehydrogenase TcuA [Yinghuangia sp. ASG 101]